MIYRNTYGFLSFDCGGFGCVSIPISHLVSAQVSSHFSCHCSITTNSKSSPKRSLMYFSRKSIITRGGKRLYAASRALSASASASSSAFAKCWVHSTSKTSAFIGKFHGRSYSSKADPNGSKPTGPGPGSPSTVGFSIPLYRKLIDAWSKTPIKWYPLPLAVGALLLVAIQYRKKSKRAQVLVDEDGIEILRLRGPWQVHVMGALPLRNMSRLWGYLNSLQLPIWFRPMGYRVYAFVFGCNLDEIDPIDLKAYPSLGAFFSRKLKPGVRPVDEAALVSPADGTVLHFGTIQDLHVEQVKGMTYSLDALLGVERPGTPVMNTSAHEHKRDMSIVDDREFANVNGIEYSLNKLIGSSSSSSFTSLPSTPTTENPPDASPDAEYLPQKFGQQIDASVKSDDSIEATLVHDTSVAAQISNSLVNGNGNSETFKRRSMSGKSVKPGHSLYFSVIYLAPGDYHRFHSPTAWVVEKRRHFSGELYSVSPYMAKRLPNLFVLNERVALLGRWRYGFFSMVPVGATNVGSIKINFDQALRTNLRGRRPPPGTYTEAIYAAASSVLNGQPLIPAEEMGGFLLGSTIVLVFEAPNTFEFSVQAGQKVRVGQSLGHVGVIGNRNQRAKDGKED